MAVAILLGWASCPSYQAFLRLCLWGGTSFPIISFSNVLCLWCDPSLPITSFPYGFSYGVTRALQLSAIPKGTPWGGTSLPGTSHSYGQSYGWPQLPTTSYCYYSYGLAPASNLPATPKTVSVGCSQHTDYQLLVCLLPWDGPQPFSDWLLLCLFL